MNSKDIKSQDITRNTDISDEQSVDYNEKPEFDAEISHSVAKAAGRVLQDNYLKSDIVKWEALKEIASEFNALVGVMEQFQPNKYSDIESDISNYSNFGKAKTRLKDMFWQLNNVFQNTLNGVSDLGDQVGPYVMAPIYFVIGELKKKVAEMENLFDQGSMNSDDIEKFKLTYSEFTKFCKNYMTEFNHVLSLVCDPFSIQSNPNESFDNTATEALFDALKIPSVPSGVISKYLSQNINDIDMNDFDETYNEFLKSDLEIEEEPLKLKINNEKKMLKLKFDIAQREGRDNQYLNTLKKHMKYWENTTPRQELEKAFRWRNFEFLTDSEVPVSLEFFHKIWNKMKEINKKIGNKNKSI